MSSLIVEICKIDKIVPHPNADSLEVAVIKGWESCVPKGKHKQGELVVYFPPDSILPSSLSDDMKITKYLSKGRVLCANLRGKKSYGAVMSLDLRPELKSMKEGDDVANLLEIKKYEPPVKQVCGDAERDCSLFHRYYDMENYKHYPNLFEPGIDSVIITEKVHGQNLRLGLIVEDGVWTWAAGSHNVRRRRFDKNGVESVYWKHLTDNVKALLAHLIGIDKHIDEIDGSTYESETELPRGAVLFGEMFGSGIQDLTYGLKNGEVNFLAFDITFNGSYLSYHNKIKLFNQFGVNHVPVLYDGLFSHEIVESLTDGKSTLYPEQIREGIVITSKFEQSAITHNKCFSRRQLKNISFDYLNRKWGTEYH